MAARYWVGGTGTWDNTAGTKWALTSGGAGGQAVPTAADDVFFNAASGAVTVTNANGVQDCLSLNFNGFTGTFAGSSASGVRAYGSITLVAGMGHTYAGNYIMMATGSFTGAGKTFSDFQVNPSAGGMVTISGGFTCDEFSVWGPCVAYFNDALTYTFNTLRCTASTIPDLAVLIRGHRTKTTLSCASGTIALTNAAILNIIATGGAIFTAPGGKDLYGNSGITFS